MFGMRKGGGMPVYYDIETGDDYDPNFLGEEILKNVGLKGYAAIKTTLTNAVLREAREEVKGMQSSERFHHVPGLVMDGLLGEEGSTRIASLSEESDFKTLNDLDERISTLATAIASTQGAADFGFELSQRTPCVIHEAGILEGDPPAMTQEMVTKWLETFMWQRLMVVLFLGPRQGTLELQPFDADCFEHRITVEAGTMLVIRSDTMWHRFSTPGEGYTMSSFIQHRGKPGCSVLFSPPKNPIAEKIDQWAMDTILDAVDDPDEVEKLDPKFRYALEHTWHKGQQYAVRGAASKVSSTWDAETMWATMNAGTDIVTEVPYSRWDHNMYYSDDPEGWKYFKVNTRHVSLMDGMELFDAKFFRISPAETKGMDPMQRQILEVGYMSLAAAGRTVKNLLQSLTAVYVGCHLSEWPMVDQGPEEAGGCEQRSAGTGQAGSIMSNRFSFVFGMNGPSVSFDTDASSSLAVLETGAIALDERKTNATMSCCVGITTVLTPLTWIHRTGLGQISNWGRCFSFDQSASGWVKAEGGGAMAIDNLTEKIEGVAVQDESRPYLGTLGSIVITHAGATATMGTPNGPANQELIAKACREAKVGPGSIDAVECFMDAQMMGDAVEMSSTRKVLCTEDRPPLCLGSVKSQYANGIQGSAMTQICKVLYNQAYGWMAPSNHLRQLNPQVDELEPCLINDDILIYSTRSSLHGVTAIGWGGTLGHAVLSCGIDKDRTPLPQPSLPYEPMVFWPGGGGQEAIEPPKGYFIVGTFNQWEEPVQMEKEAEGIYGVTVTLGANRTEEFQIYFDGDETKVMHPSMPKSCSGTNAIGPSSDPEGCSWEIDGRVLLWSEEVEGGADGSTALVVPGSEGTYYESAAGIGDQYHVNLNIAGKWRAVTWERIGGPDTSSKQDTAVALFDPAIEGKYYVSGDFNIWLPEEMQRDATSNGVFTFEVRLLRGVGFFHILRNRDPSQVFHPEFVHDESGRVFGPDAADKDSCWCLDGQAGDVFKIQFQRSMDKGIDTKRISWQKVRDEPLSDAEKSAALRPRYCMVGTWDNFKVPKEMTWTGTAYSFSVEVGRQGTASFQILPDGDWGQRIYPSEPDASPHEYHELMWDYTGGDNTWTIGQHDSESDSADTTFEVTLHVGRHWTPTKVTWNKLA